MPLSKQRAVARAVLGSASAQAARHPDDPELRQQVHTARRAYKFEHAKAYIDQIVAEAPALTLDQRDRLAALLRGGGRDG